MHLSFDFCSILDDFNANERDPTIYRNVRLGCWPFRVMRCGFKREFNEIRCIMKSPLGNEHWLQTMIRASGRMNISHMQDGAPMTPLLLSSNIKKSPFQI